MTTRSIATVGTSPDPGKYNFMAVQRFRARGWRAARGDDRAHGATPHPTWGASLHPTVPDGAAAARGDHATT